MLHLSHKGSGRRALIGLTAVLLIVLGITSSISNAATKPTDQGIQLSPVTINLNAEKGKSYNLKITVTNVTAGELVLKADVADFKAKDETGTPNILPIDDSDSNNTYSFRKWAHPISNLTLKSKESRTVIVKVDIPSDAEAGGHYGVIRFSGSPPELANQNLSLIASAGVLVLTRVEGKITENLSYKEMFVEHNGKRSGFFENGPLTIVSRLENTGNVHVKPNGGVTVKNMFGSTTVNMHFTNAPENVLPDSIRRFEQQINNKWMFGRYTVSSVLSYGTSGKTLTGSTTFWVIPYKIIIISLLFLVLVVWIFKLQLRRYNEKIIKRANKQNKKS